MFEEEFIYNGFKYKELKLERDADYVLKRGDIFKIEFGLDDFIIVRISSFKPEEDFRYLKVNYGFFRAWKRMVKKPKNPPNLPPYPYGW